MGLLATMTALGTGALTIGTVVFGARVAVSDPAASAPTQIACETARDQLPDQLRSDLEELREAAPAERAAVVSKIRHQAISGAYGEKVQALALHEARTLRTRAPQALRRDLRQILETAPHDRQALWADLRQAASAGEYGPGPQEVVQRAQDRRAECPSNE